MSTTPVVPGQDPVDGAGDSPGLLGDGGAVQPDATRPGDDPLTGCVDGHAGCPCPTEGAMAACGTASGHFGDYVTCSMGQATCTNGVWGACVGTSLMTKSLHGATLGAGGVRLLTTSMPCQDACDPNACSILSPTRGDVDASGIVITDAGLTAKPIFQSQTSKPCAGYECEVATDCPSGTTTILTGTVYDPAGKNPIPNALVYMPVDMSLQMPTLPSGESCYTCGIEAVTAVVATRTGPDGKFVLRNAPSTDVGPRIAPSLVVQAGKWRRQQLLSHVPKCQTTPVAPDQSRLPRTHTDGVRNYADIPKMALATGADDPLECVLLKMGVDPGEFQPPGGARVDYYVANGAKLSNATEHFATQFENDSNGIRVYDLILLPCEGMENDNNNQFAQTISDYANAGGRVFASHYSYTWLATPTKGMANATNPATGQTNPFFGVAGWTLGAAPLTPPITATIDVTLGGGQTFYKGQDFSDWMHQLNPSSAVGEITLGSAATDVAQVNAPSTEWTRTKPGNSPLSFTFPTPVGAPVAGAGSFGVGDASVESGATTADGGAPACGRVTFTDFHVTPADESPAASGACASDSDCGFGAKCATGQCSVVSTDFPYSCAQRGMTQTEQAIEYMLFDSTSCLLPDSQQTPLPPSSEAYVPVTFTDVFTSSCPAGTHVSWRELDWTAQIPPTSSIVFATQTLDLTATGGPPTWSPYGNTPVATVTRSSAPPQSDFVLLDTGVRVPTPDASNPFVSGDDLLLTVTLNPSSDATLSPTLTSWNVKADCLPTE